MVGSTSRIACVAGLLLWLAGCRATRTEMVVQVTTNGLAIPADIDSLRVVVTDRGQVVWSLPQTPFCLPGQRPTQSPPECLTLPLVATLFPGPKQPHDPVEVEVIAYAGATPVIDDAATFTFADGRSQLLDFVLYARCLQTDCAHEAQPHTCVDGACVALAPKPLASEPPLDGGTSAPDLAGDAGASDLAAPADLSLPDLLPAPIVLEQRSVVTSGAGGALTIAFPSTKPGDLVVATYVVCANGSTSTWTSSGVNPGCGTVLDPVSGMPVACTVHVDYTFSAGAGVTFALTYSSNAPAMAVVSEYSGVRGQPPIDSTTVTKVMSTNNMDSLGGLTRFPAELGIDVVCAVHQTTTGTATIAPGAGWSPLGAKRTGAVAFAADYQLPIPLGVTPDEHVTSGDSGDWAGVLVTLH